MTTSLPKCTFTPFTLEVLMPALSKLDVFTQRGRGDRDTHLCQDVSKLSVDFSPEGCPGNIDEGLPVHLLGHFDLLQNLKGFFLGNLKSFCYYSRVQTLRQGKRNHWRMEDKIFHKQKLWFQHSMEWQNTGNIPHRPSVLSF